MQSWFGFFALAGGASATLMGLLFVSVSLNVSSIFGQRHGSARRMAEQAFQNYLAVLVVSLLALFPTLETKTLGLVTLAVTGVSGLWVLVRIYLAIARTPDAQSRGQALRRQYPSVLGFGMLLYAALQMAIERDNSRNMFAASILVLLGSATTSSWELLVGVAKSGVKNRQTAQDSERAH